MKNLIIIVIVAAVGFAAFQVLNEPLSEEGQRIEDFEDEYISARKEFRQAEKSASLGMDSTSEAEHAMKRIQKVREDLKAVLDSIEDEAVLNKAQKLIVNIGEFLAQNGYK